MRFAPCIIPFNGNERSVFLLQSITKIPRWDLQLYLKRDPKVELLVRIPVFLALTVTEILNIGLRESTIFLYILRCHV